MKEIFSNVQALDMERNRHNVFDTYDSDNIPFELVFDDECPICKYGIDMGKNAWHKFHDISEERQKTCNVICVHYCTHCHKAFVTEHKMYISKDCYKELSHNVYPIVLSEKVFSEEIKRVSNYMYQDLIKNSTAKKIFKPMPCPIDRIKNKFRWRIIVKGSFDDSYIDYLNSLLDSVCGLNLKNTRVIIDLNPNSMM